MNLLEIYEKMSEEEKDQFINLILIEINKKNAEYSKLSIVSQVV